VQKNKTQFFFGAPVSVGPKQPANSDEEVYERLTGKQWSQNDKKASTTRESKRKKKKISR
jgi:hypothetical protein